MKWLIVALFVMSSDNSVGGAPFSTGMYFHSFEECTEEIANVETVWREKYASAHTVSHAAMQAIEKSLIKHHPETFGSMQAYQWHEVLDGDHFKSENFHDDRRDLMKYYSARARWSRLNLQWVHVQKTQLVCMPAAN